MPNLSQVPPETGATSRRGERNRDRGRGRDRGPVDHVHGRDGLPRPTLTHRSTSRGGGRRHEYRYYDPPAPRPRVRSAERKSPPAAGAAKKPAQHGDEHHQHQRGRQRGRPREGRPGRDEHHGGDGARDRDRDGRGGSHRRQAAQNLGRAAVAAGALEALRHGGAGGGDIWKRVATAALGAAAIDAAATKARGKSLSAEQGNKSTLGASVGGLVVDGLVTKMRQSKLR